MHARTHAHTHYPPAAVGSGVKGCVCMSQWLTQVFYRILVRADRWTPETSFDGPDASIGPSHVRWARTQPSFFRYPGNSVVNSSVSLLHHVFSSIMYTVSQQGKLLSDSDDLHVGIPL